MGFKFDLNSGDFIFGDSNSGNYMDHDGDFMHEIDDHHMMDFESGDIHTTSDDSFHSFGDDDDDPFKMF